MAESSILGGTRAPSQARGRDADALGPSDTSDSGSDIQGERRLSTEPEEGDLGGATPTSRSSDSDARGTGERSSAVPDGVRDGADISTDRIGSLSDSADAQDLADVMLDDPDQMNLDDLASEPVDDEIDSDDDDSA